MIVDCFVENLRNNLKIDTTLDESTVHFQIRAQRKQAD